MQQKINEILSNILEIEVREDSYLTMENCPQWTSLTHIDIVMSIEEEFGIAFDERTLFKLTSQQMIIEKVAELLNA
ncbi:acyl carrier protein [Helicobacter didelphidarum]|uniref:Acyl carrier protein n=1 Tax=Helicobacter didelphidarum TaxID=2040648 RepID=A0A3D8IMN7_9HELI|nr:acyl carrier protein [Helicobacter didelphidarum]RDU66518.1 acyl carrier protein [Helicobacter didelphidarum]